jgi:hypothetical protein
MPEDTPVTHRECAMRHQLVEQRFGTLERDMGDVKRDVSEIRVQLGDIQKDSKAFYGDAREALVWILRITAIALVLVAAGRGLDLSAFLGMV